MYCPVENIWGFKNKMEDASSVSISVAGTSPQSQDAGLGEQMLPTSTGAMMAAHSCGVGHCSAMSPDGAATSPGVWGGCGWHQEGCTAHCCVSPRPPVRPVAGGQQGPVGAFSSPTAGICALGTPELLRAGGKHSAGACADLTNLEIPYVCWGSPHGRGSVSEGGSASDGQGLAD